jgi:RND family efflux transporter MFP subunit
MLNTMAQSEPFVEGDVAPPPSTPRRTSNWLAGLSKAVVQIAIVLGIVAGGAFGMQKLIAAKPERPSRERPASLFTIAAVTADIKARQPVIRLFGETVISSQVDLRPLSAGEVIFVSPQLNPGERVAKGDVLVRVDDFEYLGAVREAEANLAQTKAVISEIQATIEAEDVQIASAREQLDLATKDLERARQLQKSGSLTEKQLDDRSLIISQRQQAVDQRLANRATQLAKLEQNQAIIARLEWKLEQAQRKLADIELKAPFDGLVSASNVATGKLVGTNDVVATLHQTGSLEAKFVLTDAQYSRLVADDAPLIGRKIKASWNIGQKSFVFDGKIARLGAEISPEKGGVEAYASLDTEAEAVGIRPGAFLSIVVPDQTYASAALVPESALYEGDIVYIVTDGKLAARNVEVVAFDGADVIVSSGIGAGDVVMTTRLTDAADGLAVKVGQLDGAAVAVVEKPQGKPRGEGGKGKKPEGAEAKGRPKDAG